MIGPSLQIAAAPATALTQDHRTHQRPRMQGEPFGMALWYSVLVPDLAEGRQSLGSWSGCSGLEVQLTPDGPFEEGGATGNARHVPGKVSYGRVTLERAMTRSGTDRVRAWLDRQVVAWANGDRGQGQEVTIELHSGPGRAGRIASWTLPEAIPVAWVMPPFSATGGIAVERLTLAHAGFLTRPEPAQRLQLIEDGDQARRLELAFNPVKVSISQSREAVSRHTTTLADPPVVDPDSLKVVLPDLRFEGVEEIRRAAELFRRWVKLEPPPRSRSTLPPPATDPPPTCTTCQQLLPSAAASGLGGRARVLRAVWGTARGGLPAALVLKSFDLGVTRFTPAGEPCRATAQLVLQEHTAVTIGRRGR